MASYIALESDNRCVIVKSQYECDIDFIIRSKGGSEADGNKNEITRVDGI